MKWNNKLTIIMICYFSFLFLGCTEKNTPSSINEIVMTEGMSITAINFYGSMTITAGKDLVRHYTWSSGTRTAMLIPRRERWNGSLGIYFPGDGNHWKKHDGITRAVLEEGQQHFENVDDAVGWIHEKNHWGYVYRDDGLVVGWDKMEGAGGTLSVSVWQIYINGIKPTILPGSENNKIIVVQK